MYVPTGYVNQAQLGDIISQVAQHLGPEVVHVAYGLRPDSTGEPSIFFRILLADNVHQRGYYRGLDRTDRRSSFRCRTAHRELGLATVFQLQEQVGTGPPA